MKHGMLLLVVFGLLVAGTSTQGAGMILVDDTSWWPGPTPPHPEPPPWPRPGHPLPRVHPFAALEVESVSVQAKITDQIAVTKIDQEFFNSNPVRLEGTFVFPVPKGAHLDRFAMEIDGKEVEAELLPAEKARHIYEDIVRKLRDPALLQYAGQDMLKVRIFPIEPNSRKRIHLSYTQLLSADGGLVGYTLPLSTEKFSCKPVKSVAVKVNVETKQSLKSIYSPTHSVDIKRDGDHRATAGLEASNLTGDADFALYFSAEKEEVGVNLLTYRTQEEDGYFLLLASPGLEGKRSEVLPKDVAFVLDTSGSMAGKKLEQAKKALQFCVENLNDNDRFEIIRFSTEIEPLFDQLVEANKSNRERAQEFVSRLKPMGATAIDDALKKALRLRPSGDSSDRPFVIIFLTDGRPTIGVTDDDRIVADVQKQDDKGTRVFCFGIGTDVNTHLLDRITAQTRAFSQYVLPEEDLEIKVSSFFSKIKEPILSDPELKFNGNVRISRTYPAPLPDLFKGQQLVLVGRFSGRGDSSAVLEGKVRGGHQKFAYDLSFPENTSENDFIPRLWATRRVGYLLDEIRLHGENAELRDEVTELARKYGIVTPYTAYLIVEDEQRRDVPVPMRSMPRLSEDGEARREAARSWHQFTTDTSGDAGVASALSGMALRSAQAPAQAAMNADAAFSRRYGLATSGGRAGGSPNSIAPAAAVTTELTPQSQFVSGKTFFLNGNQWVDSSVQKTPRLERVSVTFASPAYFQLIAKLPQATAWLALGRNVQFVWDGRIYEVHE